VALRDIFIATGNRSDSRFTVLAPCSERLQASIQNDNWKEEEKADEAEMSCKVRSKTISRDGERGSPGTTRYKCRCDEMSRDRLRTCLVLEVFFFV